MGVTCGLVLELEFSPVRLLGIHRPARDWEILNCRLVTQHYKMH
jgi:hypothetical protein